MLTAGELIWLIAAIARGEGVAFERLYAATRDRLYGVILRILPAPVVAERVLCESYLQIWRSAARYDARTATPMTWMVAIARGRALDVARRAEPVPDEGYAAAALGAFDRAATEVTEELRLLLFCLGQLADDERQMILLAYYGGRTRDQLAATFDRPAEDVKASLRRALSRVGGLVGTEDREGVAAEYVLGTLDGDERVQAQALILLDPGFAATVQAWERRLGELHLMVAPAAPATESWETIKAQLSRTEKIEEIFLPAVAWPQVAAPIAVAAEPVPSDVAIFALRRMRAWRRLALLLLAFGVAAGAWLALRATESDPLSAALWSLP
jgi:RNA polymerase sigma-70 factor (ECF subfamily)